MSSLNSLASGAAPCIAAIAFAAVAGTAAASAQESPGRYQISDQCQEFGEYRTDPDRKVENLSYIGSECGKDIAERISTLGKDLYYRLPVVRERQILGEGKYAHIPGTGAPTEAGTKKWGEYQASDGAVKEAVKTQCSKIDFQMVATYWAKQVNACFAAIDKASRHFNIAVDRDGLNRQGEIIEQIAGLIEDEHHTGSPFTAYKFAPLIK